MRREEIVRRMRYRLAALSSPIKIALKRFASFRIRGVVLWGPFRRVQPFSEVYGYDRGTPIDRWMIGEFLRSRSADITGRVLEVREDSYARLYGNGVTQTSVLDVDPLNERANVIADLGEQGSLPRDRFDCAIVTQTLQYVSDLEAALRNLHDCLVPGGTLLLTVPCVSRLDPDAGYDADLWRFTPAGTSKLLSRHFLQWEVAAMGNCFSAASFLMGLSAEELSEQEISYSDAGFPLIVCAQATREP